MNMESLLDIENAAASMMTEMPESRHEYKPDGLPFEGLDPAFCVPVDFDRIVGILWEDLKTLEGFAISANRYSEKYLSYSRELETLMRKVGSLLVTQAVLEQQGHAVSSPKGLTVGELKWTAGYHFNKTHSAVKGTQNANIRFYIAMLQQETRWAGLIGRLNATEEKIRLIREGKLEVRLVPEQAEDDNPKGTSRKTAEREENASVKAALPAALPMDKDVLRAAAGSDVRVVKSAKAEKTASGKARGVVSTASETGQESSAAGKPDTKIETADTGKTESGKVTRREAGRTGTNLTAGAETSESSEENGAAADAGEETSPTAIPDPDRETAEHGSASGIIPVLPDPEGRKLSESLPDMPVRTDRVRDRDGPPYISGTELRKLLYRFQEEYGRTGFPDMAAHDLRPGSRSPCEEVCRPDGGWEEEYEYALMNEA